MNKYIPKVGDIFKVAGRFEICTCLCVRNGIFSSYDRIGRICFSYDADFQKISEDKDMLNNEQVIKYIAENSKHTHAAIIAEWLITGWQVEFHSTSGRWLEASIPNWGKDTKYRLVKPQIKPAYRLYKYKNQRGSCAQNRYEDGTISHHVNDKDVIWLTPDWIEYDTEPKKWPTPLVKRIAAIDIKAAEWIVDNWDELLTDKYIYKGRYSRDSTRLDQMFCWAESDYDEDYWYDISMKLCE